jgi:hypothetical protein
MFIKVRAQKRAPSYNSQLNAAALASFVRARDEVLSVLTARLFLTDRLTEQPTKQPTNEPHDYITNSF